MRETPTVRWLARTPIVDLGAAGDNGGEAIDDGGELSGAGGAGSGVGAVDGGVGAVDGGVGSVTLIGIVAVPVAPLSSVTVNCTA